MQQSSADLSLSRLTSIGSLVIEPAGNEIVLLRDSFRAVALRLEGARVSIAPVTVTFLIHGVPDARRLAVFEDLADLLNAPQQRIVRSRERLFLRDALVALDGRRVGASYRDMAAILYGSERTRIAWSGLSRWMKDRMRRALARGEYLRDGGYRNLLG